MDIESSVACQWSPSPEGLAKFVCSLNRFNMLQSRLISYVYFTIEAMNNIFHKAFLLLDFNMNNISCIMIIKQFYVSCIL